VRQLLLCRLSFLVVLCKFPFLFYKLWSLRRRKGGNEEMDCYAANNLNSSFAQSVCIIGYTLFPLVIAALMSALGLPSIPRIPIYLVLVAWSLAAGVSILGGSGVIKNRLGLAIYPLFVFYLALGCLCFIS
jgi:hypothetical protein